MIHRPVDDRPAEFILFSRPQSVTFASSRRSWDSACRRCAAPGTRHSSLPSIHRSVVCARVRAELAASLEVADLFSLGIPRLFERRRGGNNGVRRFLNASFSPFQLMPHQSLRCKAGASSDITRLPSPSLHRTQPWLSYSRRKFCLRHGE